MKTAHFTAHVNSGGITAYIYSLCRQLQKNNGGAVVFSSGGDFEADFTGKGIPHYLFDLKSKFEFHPKLFFQAAKIISVLRDEKIDIIHAHTRAAQVLAAWISRKTGIPYITTCHGFYKRRLGRRLVPAWGKSVIAISDGVAQHLTKDHGVSPSRIRTIYNGIDTDYFSKTINQEGRKAARAKWGLGENDFVPAIVARLTKVKGAGDFLEAVACIAGKYPHLKAIVAGEGPDRAELEKFVHAKGIDKKIIFTGGLKDVREALAACDLFVHPARWVEAFGLSIVEAMAAGKPFVMTDHWALYDLLKNKNAGFFVQKENAGQIAEAIESAISDPVRLALMGENARYAAEEFFDIRRMAREITEVYEETV